MGALVVCLVWIILCVVCYARIWCIVSVVGCLLIVGILGLLFVSILVWLDWGCVTAVFTGLVFNDEVCGGFGVVLFDCCLIAADCFTIGTI